MNKEPPDREVCDHNKPINWDCLTCRTISVLKEAAKALNDWPTTYVDEIQWRITDLINELEKKV